MDYSPDHWVNSVAWGKGVGPMMSGGVEWVNAMSVVYSGAWVGASRSAWRKREADGERWRQRVRRETQRKK